MGWEGHLRCAENVRVHAVLLCEDEGDNALRQRCLLTTEHERGKGYYCCKRRVKAKAF